MVLLLPGVPRSAAPPVPYGPLGEGVWGLGQGDGYIKKKLQKKRKTEEKRNRGSELKWKSEDGGEQRRNNIFT